MAIFRLIEKVTNMTNFKKIKNPLLYAGLGMAFFSQAAYAQKSSSIADQLQITWQVKDGQNIRKNPVSTIILKNKGRSAIQLNDWSLWFNFIRSIDPDKVDNRFAIDHRNGDLFQVSFKKNNFLLKAQDTIHIDFTTTGLVNYTDGPIGLYVKNSKTGLSTDILNYTAVKTAPQSDTEKADYWSYKYDQNQLTDGIEAQSIIPLPSNINIDNNAKFNITNDTKVLIASEFASEANFLTDFLNKYTGIKLSPSSAKEDGIVIVKTNDLKPESYRLNIDAKGIHIEASDKAGAFYAIQSLKSLINHQQWNKTTKSIALPYAKIEDSPRYGYRGFMLDAARNFHSKAEVLRILDLMAAYKLNKFHFHFIDDEGWRLEIPSLPELTAVGANRTANFEDGKGIQPAYGSGATAKAHQFYTVADYIEILKYAQARHIDVIPEVETPGHARAAIKAMRARYAHFTKVGDKQKAEEFLLDDADDKSIYNSAQNWNDNVMNPVLPSTYHFLGKVVDEIKAIHEKAGVPLKIIDLGGDETPSGVWEKSPKILAFMKENNISNVLDVWPIYIAKINQLVQSKGLTMSGWEEMGMRNKGKGMEVNAELGKSGIHLNVWNNLPGQGQEDLAYKLANAGYKVVYTSAANNYLDMSWDRDFADPGHSWVGTVNLNRTYSFAPENFFINLRKDDTGKDLVKEAYTNKVQLTAEGKKNLLGIKGALWAEKVSTDQRLEEMIFPRLIAIADRAWAQEQAWEKGNSYDEATYRKSYTAFIKKLGEDELRKLDIINGGYTYRLPKLGIKKEGNQLYINTDYPGFKVYYTENGSTPNLKSKEVNGAIPFQAGNKYLFKVFDSKGRSGDVIAY
ncbi:beta-N-acetylhexosaminidase [Sphingobacterium puteale]|uniref:beta-N-acetylhexosaminidase n=1 Tax=Sphingobacterium puteale TaxID=2420510 RepID=A0A420VW14_9SPHI|nr:family 20 glycosylhydrolase [Sphingobacterium puteale]RKO70427.1 beta-N-acetylhexosaminidase [Sphingobacterium puteale]